jgi:hypothetical protein
VQRDGGVQPDLCVPALRQLGATPQRDARRTSERRAQAPACTAAPSPGASGGHAQPVQLDLVVQRPVSEQSGGAHANLPARPFDRDHVGLAVALGRRIPRDRGLIAVVTGRRAGTATSAPHPRTMSSTGFTTLAAGNHAERRVAVGRRLAARALGAAAWPRTRIGPSAAAGWARLRLAGTYSWCVVCAPARKPAHL